jgi:hypothetical protein
MNSFAKNTAQWVANTLGMEQKVTVWLTELIYQTKKSIISLNPEQVTSLPILTF